MSRAAADRVPRLPSGAPNMKRLLRWANVQIFLDMGSTAAWRLRKGDPTFPKPIDLPGIHPRWDIEDLSEWVRQRKAERDGGAA